MKACDGTLKAMRTRLVYANRVRNSKNPSSTYRDIWENENSGRLVIDFAIFRIIFKSTDSHCIMQFSNRDHDGAGGKAQKVPQPRAWILRMIFHSIFRLQSLVNLLSETESASGSVAWGENKYQKLIWSWARSGDVAEEEKVNLPARYAKWKLTNFSMKVRLKEKR